MSEIKFISVKHSFNAGDLITIMPGLRQLYLDNGRKIKVYQRINFPAYYYQNNVVSTKDDEGNSVCMNEDIFKRIKPLIEAQEYIDSLNIWQGESVDYDYDLTRDSKSIPMPAGIIHSWSETIFPETSTNLAIKWLEVPKCEVYKDKMLINKTQRYNNPYISYFFLKEHRDNIMFSGTKIEHNEFCKQWGFEVELLKTNNFYELAQIISNCKFGIYNQSLHFHIADGLKAKRILELCPAFPNTFITGANGNQFYHQKSFEFIFNKLLNER